MLSEQQIRDLLNRKAETKNLDFKEKFNWDTGTKDEKCGLAKDILALFNTRDGGWIIVGVADKTYEPIGSEESAFRSFDTTKLNDFVHKYTDPIASCGLEKAVIDGKKFIVIPVPEFRDIPLICKADANAG
jgi:predicted HTH transcriptional regulator